MDEFIPLIYAAFAVGLSLLLSRFLHKSTTDSVLSKLPGPSSSSFWTGNIPQFFDRFGEAFQKEVSLNYGPVVRMHGLLGRTILYISDPKALHSILIKEANIFEETPLFIATNSLIFGKGLLGTQGDHHRRQRKILNPVFSVNHMRYMLPIFYNVMSRLRKVISSEIERGETEVDVLELCGRAALELIGQGGLGYSFDPLLSSETRNEYGDALKSLLPTLTDVELLRRALPYVWQLGPRTLRRRIVDAFPSRSVQKVKNVVDTMYGSSVEIYKAKLKAMEQGDQAVLRQIGEGKDIMSVLIQANNASTEKERLPEEELIAQMSTLVFAATDTTSNTLARILHLLAEHKDIQAKLREELLTAGAADGISYDTLNRLPFLDAVCRETLRCYPPATTLMRSATADSVVPLSKPVHCTDGSSITELPIAKGTEVMIGIMGSNLSKVMWGDDALEWKPSRWLSPLPSAVTDASIPGVYSHLMTFLGGKRACIGFKFSETEMKVALSVLLSTFTFEMSDKPIVWNVAGVWYPTVGKDSDLPQLPMKVGLYKRYPAQLSDQ